MTVPLCNFVTMKLQLTGNVTKGHIFVVRNVSIQYIPIYLYTFGYGSDSRTRGPLSAHLYSILNMLLFKD